MTDSLLSHLLDIASDPASEDLILGGGYGIVMKQAYLKEAKTRVLIPKMPEARATQDLDFFLRIDLFIQKERGKAVRQLLDRLGYEVRTPKWQFGKPYDAAMPDIKVKVDLLARTLLKDENVLLKTPRVGVGSGTEIHGRETPEAFAVEEKPIRISLSGFRTDKNPVKSSILVPHPYAFINMKVKAAHDWLEMERGTLARKKNAERHVSDVYMLTAMLTETELDEAAELAKRFESVPIAKEIRESASELYGDLASPGVIEVQRQLKGEMDHPLFCRALRFSLGIIDKE